MLLHRFARTGDTVVDRMPESGLSRRTFLRAGVAATGGLLLSISLPRLIGDAEAAGADSFAPGAFIRIGRDGSVTLIIGQVEMGQGTYTALPMLIAEELEVELNQVQIEHAPPDDKLFGNPLIGFQVTGGSNVGACLLGAPAARGRDRQDDAGDRGGEELECRADLMSGRKG